MKIVFLIIFFPLFLSQAFANEEDGELYDLKWLDSKDKIFVLQNKVYEKKNTFYFNLGYGMNLSNDFQDGKLPIFKTGYFFLEEWGIEALYAKISNSDSDTMKSISMSNLAIPFVRRINNYYALSLIYSPFYGKVNAFNKIFYLDINLGLGLTKISGESNQKAFINENSNYPYEKESSTGLLLQLESRFYITESVFANINLLRSYFYAKNPRSQADEVFTSTDLVFSMGYGI